MILESARQEIKSWRSLRNILLVYGIAIGEDEAENAWESMGKPISLGRRGLAHSNFLMGREMCVRRIAGVWEKGNRRFVLWNDRCLEVAKAGSWYYNYLEKGFHEFNSFLITSQELPGEMIAKMRKVSASWERNYPFRGDPFLRERRRVVSLNDIGRMLDRKVAGVAEKLPPDRRHNRKLMNWLAGRLEKGSGIRFTERSLLIQGRPFGVIGKPPWEYIDFGRVAEDHDIRGNPKEAMLCGIVEGVLALREDVDESRKIQD